VGKKRIQFVSDDLVEQIIAGRKTASAVPLGEVDHREDEYKDYILSGRRHRHEVGIQEY
jgi:hypothetical protein